MLLLLLDFPWYSLARELVAPLLSFWGFLRYVSTHHWWLSSFSWTGKPDRFRIKCNFRFPQTMPGFLLCGTEVAAMTQRRLAPYGLHDLDSRIVLASSGRSVWTSAKIRKKNVLRLGDVSWWCMREGFRLEKPTTTGGIYIIYNDAIVVDVRPQRVDGNLNKCL